MSANARIQTNRSGWSSSLNWPQTRIPTASCVSTNSRSNSSIRRSRCPGFSVYWRNSKMLQVESAGGRGNSCVGAGAEIALDRRPLTSSNAASAEQVMTFTFGDRVVMTWLLLDQSGGVEDVQRWSFPRVISRTIARPGNEEVDSLTYSLM